MLSLNKVSKRFGGLPALDKVSFSVKKGTITALIGPNGAGKSTLINCITGVIPPDDGEILFGDRQKKNIAGLEPHVIARQGIARTFQNLRILPTMSVLDNILCGLTVQASSSFTGAMLRLPSLRSRERLFRLRALEMLDRFGLSGRADWPISVLPYGDRKKVEMARAFVSEPDLVLLDEPVAGLNQEETGRIAVLLKQMRQAGFTMLLVEHDMELVMRISDHVVVLDSGRCIARSTPQEVRTNPLVLEAYLGTTGRAA
ncbi:ABC transporter ATP-binding protein [Desulfolithobacter dissulfuricans]|uniref:ABC transporter ATP-binding protein n=1 Tax=Desulfolithobacter dissulfuricans TaxID=2795293 RepID=A0A915UBI0_9BACT|nr:ABC transporter ATP-binding protein [Desulfolithobacter dissulfuricans]BCO10730.1 ABC transporter ATP-binding protein [Desulfolithobacter dissulfuricans]